MESREHAVVEALWALIGRLARLRPFDGPNEEIAARLAFLAGARSVAVFEADGDRVRLLAEHAVPNDYLRRFPLRDWRALTRLPGDLQDARRTRQPVRVESIVDDPRTRSLAGAAQAGNLSSTFAAPIVFDGRLVGLLHGLFDARRTATRARHLERARALLAPALARQRQPAGPVDEGQSLHGEPQLKRSLRQAHAAARRYGRRYAIIVYQLERPHALSRRYGPAFAAMAAQRLAEIAASQIRTVDAAGRIGGLFEVLVVLPDTTQDGAFAHACRVLERFGQESFPFGDGRLQVPARAGISSWPDNGATDGEASVKAAQQAVSSAEGSWVVALAGKDAARAPEHTAS